MFAPRLFSHLRQRGIPVWFLGVNDEYSIEISIKAGATSLLTDKVAFVKNYVEEKKLQFQDI